MSKWFIESPLAKEIPKIRKFETKDIVRRLGFVSPSRIYLKNYPISTPVSLFNAAFHLKNEELIRIYGRIVLGYYMYVSAIIKVDVPMDDVLSGDVSIAPYLGEIVVYPTTKYDIWGVEDPRVYEIDGKLYMTYCGRTINYFNPAIRKERTSPVTAVEVKNGTWEKILVTVLPDELREHLISDKDAFLFKIKDEVLLFHRPHMDDEKYYLTLSRIDSRAFKEASERKGKVTEVKATNIVHVMEPAEFESKIGWATPPIEAERGKYIVLLHGVDKEIQGYRVFAALMEYDEEWGMRVTAVTPYYIMEPKMSYEIFGDRPYVVFPCGAWRVKDKILITYGAADTVTGIGEIDINELMSILDKGRIEK